MDFAEVPPLANRARVKGLVGNAHRKYELDMLFVFRIPSVKGLTMLLLKQVWTYSHRAGPGPLVGLMQGPAHFNVQ